MATYHSVHIPPETLFVLATQRDRKGNKQHEIEPQREHAQRKLYLTYLRWGSPSVSWGVVLCLQGFALGPALGLQTYLQREMLYTYATSQR